MAEAELSIDSADGLVCLGFEAARVDTDSGTFSMEASAQHDGEAIGFVAVVEPDCEPQPMVAFTEYWYLATVRLQSLGVPSDRLVQLLDSYHATSLGVVTMTPVASFLAIVFTRGAGAEAPEYLAMNLLGECADASEDCAVSVDIDLAAHRVWLRQTREGDLACRRAFVRALGRGAAEQGVEADEAR